MVRSTIRCLLLVGSLSLLPASLSLAQEQITWLTPDFSLGSGPALEQKTMVGPLLDLLQAQWGAGVRQQVLVANAKRSWSLIRAGEQVCHLVSLRTPDREAQAYFINTHLVPPPQLVVRTPTLPQLPLNAAGEVDLERLWQQQRLRGAVVEGRSYGRGLDALLAQRPAGVMENYTPADFGMRMLQLLAGGRIDYTLDYDFVLQHQKTLSPALADLTPVPLQGHAEPLVSGIACPRTPWGAKAAQRLRQLLATPAGIAALKASFDPGLSPQARARYGARIQAYYEQLPAQLAQPMALD